MELQPLAPSFATAVTGFDAASASDEDVASLRELLYARKVVALKGQRLDRDTYQAFAARFGTLQSFRIKQYHDPAYPNILVIDNVGKCGMGARKLGNMWHTDSSYLPEPLPLTFLHARRVPPPGLGDTLFVDVQEDALALLAPSMLAWLQGRQAVHDIRWTYKVKPEDIGESVQEIFDRLAVSAPAVSHPTLCVHPVTGRTSLYVNPGYTVRIEGCTEEASRALLQEIASSVLAPQRVFAYRWEIDDLLLWDNRAVWHAATALPPDAERVMYRIGVADGPFFGRGSLRGAVPG